MSIIVCYNRQYLDRAKLLSLLKGIMHLKINKNLFPSTPQSNSFDLDQTAYFDILNILLI